MRSRQIELPADFLAVLYREYVLYTRDRINLLLGIVPTAAYLFLFATSMGNVIQDIAYKGTVVSYTEFTIATIILSSMLAGASTAAGSLFNEELGGMTLEIWSYPVRRMSYIVGKLTATTMLVLTQGLASLLVASLVLRPDWHAQNLASFLLCFVLSSLALNGLYLTVSTRVKSFQSFLVVINVAAPLLLFASPSFYALSDMPTPIRLISRLNPVTYAVTSLRDSWFFGIERVMLPIGVLGAIILGSLVLVSRSLAARTQGL